MSILINHNFLSIFPICLLWAVGQIVCRFIDPELNLEPAYSATTPIVKIREQIRGYELV